MNIKEKHIVIGLAATLILILYYGISDEDYSDVQSGTQHQIYFESQPSSSSFKSDQGYPSSSSWSHNQSNPSRHENLQSKLNGYREETYWGEYTSTDEKIRYMNDDEFDRLIDEAELNDADVYWGAEY